jgi:hypothetical protein
MVSYTAYGSSSYVTTITYDSGDLLMTTHLQIVKCIKRLSAIEFTLSGDDIENIDWLTDEQFTKAQIEAAIAESATRARTNSRAEVSQRRFQRR